MNQLNEIWITNDHRGNEYFNCYCQVGSIEHIEKIGSGWKEKELLDNTTVHMVKLLELGEDKWDG